MWGGGNPLNIIRIGGALEQFNIVLCNDLNGCISNLLVGTRNYSLTWNTNYPYNNGRDMTQNNTSQDYYTLHGNSPNDINNDILNGSRFFSKDIFDTSNMQGGIGVNGNLRPIIEYRE